MIKYIFFKLVDFLYLFSKKDFHIVQKYKYTDGNVYIEYIYNNKSYVYTGDESKFPPSIKQGFVPCIKNAKDDNGSDITDYVKKCAGPKHDFYGHEPRPQLLLGKFIAGLQWNINYGKISFQIVPVLKPADDGKIILTNIFNQTRVLEKT